MIAPNDNQPGRNDPCPCGSGLKYKRCCLNPQVKRLHLELRRMTAVAYLALTQLQQLTKTSGMTVAREVLADLPDGVRVAIKKEPLTGAFLLAALPPEKPESQVIGPRRIILSR